MMIVIVEKFILMVILDCKEHEFCHREICVYAYVARY